MTDQIDHHGSDRPTTGEDHRLVIAIDGPAAAGKSTVARALADRLGATYLDTGLLYRAMTLATLRAGLSPTDGEAIAKLAETCRLRISPPRAPGETEQVELDGQIVTHELRTPEIDRHVSAVSAHRQLREALLPIQRRIAAEGKVVMAGRDITTVVLPDAGVKVYLDASADERARRRLKEFSAANGSDDYAAMLREIERRDFLDSTREVAPLHAGRGVTVVNTDGRGVDEIVDEIAELARRAWCEEPVAAKVTARR